LKKKKHLYSIKNKVLIGLLVFSNSVFGQPSPGDDYGPPDLPGGTDTPMGGSAPIDGGIWLLIGFALLYLLFKYRIEIRLYLSRIQLSLR
jgi:hypothetical protein